jgi:hypothetical protein
MNRMREIAAERDRELLANKAEPAEAEAAEAPAAAEPKEKARAAGGKRRARSA